MKRLIITLVLGLFILPSISFAQSDSGFNSEQLALRTDLFNFLMEEGFMPELDSDGDIKFKSEYNRQNDLYNFVKRNVQKSNFFASV